jgi:hypothetical protein
LGHHTRSYVGSVTSGPDHSNNGHRSRHQVVATKDHSSNGWMMSLTCCYYWALVATGVVMSPVPVTTVIHIYIVSSSSVSRVHSEFTSLSARRLGKFEKNRGRCFDFVFLEGFDSRR